MADWYVVNTKPGAERYASDFLASTNSRRYASYATYLPMVAGNRGAVLPFIPRYLFVADEGAGTWGIRNAPGVVGMMRGGVATMNEAWERISEPDTGVVRVGQDVVDAMRSREGSSGLIELDDDERSVRLGMVKRKTWRKDEKFEIRDGAGVVVMAGLFKQMRGEERALVFISRVVHGREVGFMKATVPVSKMMVVT